MKATDWFIIFAFLPAVPLAAQDGGATCAEYNPPLQVQTIPEQSSSQYHITGYHYYNSQGTSQCLYTDPSTNLDQYCAAMMIYNDLARRYPILAGGPC